MPLEDENAAFCPHCGKPLTEQTAAEETAAEAAEEKKTEAAPAAEGNAPGAPKKPNGKLIGIVAAAIAVVAVALILLIPRLKQNAQGETPVVEQPAAEEVQPSEQPAEDADSADSTDAAEPAVSYSATAEELTALPGLGPRKAAALVAYREEHGPFAALADAAAVKGISLRMTESWAGLAAANH